MNLLCLQYGASDIIASPARHFKTEAGNDR